MAEMFVRIELVKNGYEVDCWTEAPAEGDPYHEAHDKYVFERDQGSNTPQTLDRALDRVRTFFLRCQP